MSIKNYFIMPTKRNYSLKEDYVLALLEMNSDSKVSHISRGKLCELSGIKDPRTITRMTNMFEKDGYISKVTKHTSVGNLVEYHINKSKFYTVVFNSILQYKELGVFAIKLAEYRVNGTPCIYMSDNELIKNIKCRRADFFKYKNQLIKEGILIQDTDCYVLNTEYFPIFKEISDDTREHIKNLLNMDENFTGRKVFLFYYKNNFQNLNCSVDHFVNYCLAGCPGIRREKEKPKEFEEINIKF